MRKSPYSLIQLVLAFAGFFVASLLYYAHIRDLDLPCSSGGGCITVSNSAWSQIGHFPVALIGAMGYALLAVMAMGKMAAESERAKALLRWCVLLISLFGTAYSWYLQYAAAVYVGAFCIYCRTSAIVMTLLFLSALIEIIAFGRKRGAVATHQVSTQ